jgi:hypothetical protein
VSLQALISAISSPADLMIPEPEHGCPKTPA